jgi:hypothetical protein
MIIPVTKNLSTSPTDVVGHLHLQEELANVIASCVANGIELRLKACVSKNGDEYKLMHVSIVPVETQ